MPEALSREALGGFAARILRLRGGAGRTARMSENGSSEPQVEVVIAAAETSAAGENEAAIRRELRDIRRRLEGARLLLGAILAVTAACLALLIVLVSRAP